MVHRPRALKSLKNMEMSAHNINHSIRSFNPRTKELPWGWLGDGGPSFAKPGCNWVENGILVCSLCQLSTCQQTEFWLTWKDPWTDWEARSKNNRCNAKDTWLNISVIWLARLPTDSLCFQHAKLPGKSGEWAPMFPRCIAPIPQAHNKTRPRSTIRRLPALDVVLVMQIKRLGGWGSLQALPAW